ncbi:MAG: hypothetical protein L0228_06935 [Planctomycetes bacterium]|nr:hypothetical protein [Planctomycetota bacterium]
MTHDVSSSCRYPALSRTRPQFSVLALLLFVTLECLVLTWWTVTYPAMQRREHSRLVRDLQKLNGDITLKWDQYIRIAKEQHVKRSAFTRDRDHPLVATIELETRMQELERLQRAANTLAMKLEKMKANTAGGGR